MWYLKLQTFLASLLSDESGGNAVEYALIMALCAVFIISISSGLIISGLILLSTQMGHLFNSMTDCLAEPAVCPAESFGPDEGPCNVAHENCGDN